MADKVPKARYFDAPVENGAIFLRIEPDVDVDVRPTIDILFSNPLSDIRIDLPVLNIAELIHGAVWHVLHTLHIFKNLP